jgi:hypothetical protein
MSNFFERQTKEIEIDGENRVTIRKLTHAERQAALSVTFHLEKEGQLAMGNAAIQAMLKLSIVSWAGPGFADYPVSAENIDALPAEIVDEIVLAINDFTALSSAKKKRSRASMNGA